MWSIGTIHRVCRAGLENSIMIMRYPICTQQTFQYWITVTAEFSDIKSQLEKYMRLPDIIVRLSGKRKLVFKIFFPTISLLMRIKQKSVSRGGIRRKNNHVVWPLSFPERSWVYDTDIEDREEIIVKVQCINFTVPQMKYSLDAENCKNIKCFCSNPICYSSLYKRLSDLASILRWDNTDIRLSTV